jgi:hypothetical protein
MPQGRGVPVSLRTSYLERDSLRPPDRHGQPPRSVDSWYATSIEQNDQHWMIPALRSALKSRIYCNSLFCPRRSPPTRPRLRSHRPSALVPVRLPLGPLRLAPRPYSSMHGDMAVGLYHESTRYGSRSPRTGSARSGSSRDERATGQLRRSGPPQRFPALGRLDFFESSLAFLAGYGVRIPDRSVLAPDQ